MNHYLQQHPEIFIPDAKELQFFGSDIEMKPTFIRSTHRFGVSEEQYLSYFSAAREAKRVGESTVMYLYSKRAAEEIKAYQPNADIIIMLRHPVDMMYSLYGQYRYDLNEDLDTFEQALDAETDRREGRRIPNETFWSDALLYRDVARFSVQVGRYLDVFDRKKIHVILFDDLQSDAAQVYQRTLSFLNVDPGFCPDFRLVNAGKSFRNKWLHRSMIDPPKIVQFLAGPLLRNSTIRAALKRWIKLLNTKTRSNPPLDPDLRERLTAEFAPEVEELARLIRRDLSLWLPH